MIIWAAHFCFSHRCPLQVLYCNCSSFFCDNQQPVTCWHHMIKLYCLSNQNSFFSASSSLEVKLSVWQSFSDFLDGPCPRPDCGKTEFSHALYGWVLFIKTFCTLPQCWFPQSTLKCYPILPYSCVTHVSLIVSCLGDISDRDGGQERSSRGRGHPRQRPCGKTRF